MKRAPSKESEEEEILPVGEGRRLRGEAPGKPGVCGAAFSGPRVGPEPLATALPQEGQKRAAPGTSLPQAGQLMAVARVYITVRFQARTLSSDHSRRNGVLASGRGRPLPAILPRCGRHRTPVGAMIVEVSSPTWKRCERLKLPMVRLTAKCLINALIGNLRYWDWACPLTKGIIRSPRSPCSKRKLIGG
jgi:hypothetical protein